MFIHRNSRAGDVGEIIVTLYFGSLELITALETLEPLREATVAMVVSSSTEAKETLLFCHRI